MRKFILLTLTLVMGIIAAWAQTEPKGKMNVFFDYFDRPASMPFIWAETIRNNVMDNIRKTNRVVLIDVDSNEALAIERERREKDNFAVGEDPERMRVMTEEGANLLLKGIVTDVTVTEKTDSNGQTTGYTSSLSFTLKVIDPSNGTTVYLETFKISPGLTAGLPIIDTFGSSKDEAVQIRAQKMEKQMKKFVEMAFPTEGRIIDLDEVKGDDVKTAYINLGSANGMAKGAKFEVRVKRLIAGAVSFSLVGQAEVVDVEGDGVSKVKIKSGGKKIYEAFKADQEVVVKSVK